MMLWTICGIIIFLAAIIGLYLSHRWQAKKEAKERSIALDQTECLPIEQTKIKDFSSNKADYDEKDYKEKLQSLRAEIMKELIPQKRSTISQANLERIIQAYDEIPEEKLKTVKTEEESLSIEETNPEPKKKNVYWEVTIDIPINQRHNH